MTNPWSDREARIKAARRKKVFRRSALAAVAILIAVGAIFALSRYVRAPAGGLGETLSDQGQDHAPLGTAFAYNSNPPSSGPHFTSPANWGVYDYEVNDQIFLHNLEHGGIWISYRPSVPADAVEELKAIAEEFGKSKIVMAPRSANDADIAIVAWTRVRKFDLSAEQLTDQQKGDIRNFYKAYKNRGPEFVPDTAPGIDPKSAQR